MLKTKPVTLGTTITNITNIKKSRTLKLTGHDTNQGYNPHKFPNITPPPSIQKALLSIVKPVYSDCPRKTQKVAFVDRWS